ncbi:YslB family protein [Aeribacillus pallidus]|jgi:predicted hydrocarbon binding protein|uniref:YslB family protein n=1 Tax=Aeribacillus pallidus TaxID=33936 RepID=UPI001DC034D8|nr:YslB family protein [Bacillus sp. (in: firmicutes)]
MSSNEMKHIHEEQLPVFGYELIRDFVLPDLLGQEADGILYWAGKNIARKFPLTSIEEIVTFFEEAGWGQLSIIYEKKDELLFELSGSIVKRRLEINKENSFKIEAGFLAQQIQSQKKAIAETFEEKLLSKQKVRFTVRWDRKDVTDD